MAVAAADQKMVRPSYQIPLKTMKGPLRMDGSKWWHWIIYLGFPVLIIGGLLLANYLVDRSYYRFSAGVINARVSCVTRQRQEYLGMHMSKKYWLDLQERYGEDWSDMTEEQAEIRAWRGCFKNYLLKRVEAK